MAKGTVRIVGYQTFHFTIGPNVKGLGSRCPALLTYGGKYYFRHQLDGLEDQYILSRLPIAMNVFTNFYYEQKYNVTIGNYVVRAFINNTLVSSDINRNASVFHNVKVYTSDPWHEPLDCIIKDFKFGFL